MLKRVRGAVLWARALHHWRGGDSRAAADFLDRMEALAPLPLRALAVRAVLYASMGELERMDDLLDDLAHRTEAATDGDRRYINLFVRSFRAEIEGNAVLHQHFLREAAAVRCSSYVRSLLPLDLSEL